MDKLEETYHIKMLKNKKKYIENMEVIHIWIMITLYLGKLQAE